MSHRLPIGEETPDPADGWIAFTGGGCPVPSATVVEVFTEREKCIGWTSCPRAAAEWDWSVEDVPGDIIAYRVVQP